MPERRLQAGALFAAGLICLCLALLAAGCGMQVRSSGQVVTAVGVGRR